MAMETKIPFVEEAIRTKKWAFAADVIRLYALYHEGGIYMDSDIFLKRRFDEFLNNDFITFQEYHLSAIDQKTVGKDGVRQQKQGSIPGIGIQAAFMASIPQHHFVKKLMDYYLNNSFILANDKLNISMIAPAIYAIEAESIGYRYLDKTQKLQDITIYESKYLAGGISEDTNMAFAIHCCNQSWRTYSFKDNIKKKVLNILYLCGLKKRINKLEYLNSITDK